MRQIKWLRAVLLAMLLIVPVITGEAQTGPHLFTTEQQAQQHCPADTTVWVNLPSGIYHFKGQRWYANTRHGAFVCRKEADQGGFHATMNGQ